MGFRRVLEEFEADLYKVPEPWLLKRKYGELERKRYADGTENLEIAFSVDVPNGSTVSVAIGGRVVADVLINGRRGRMELTSDAGVEVPPVANGDVAEVRYEGRPLLRGTFRPD